MLQAINEETKQDCNLCVQVCSANKHCNLYDGARDWRYYILQGKRMETENFTKDYDWEFFYAYEGIYW